MTRTKSLFATVVFLFAACPSEAAAQTQQAPPLARGQAEAIFAGGCFWCMEAPFEAIPGVLSVTSGFTGGASRAPSYHQVSAGGTGHAEAVRIVFDPARVSYQRLLEVYWHNVDPTQRDGQFCDHGDQYRTAIFVVNADQRRLAEASRERVRQQLRATIVTQIVDARAFWVAEGYHQNFYRTNPDRYQSYRAGCGRDRRLRQLWGAGSAH